MSQEDTLLTRKEAMEYLRISHGTLHKLMIQHALPYIKLERKVLFRKSEIDKFLESRSVK
jgi:excisionase family DNA binding protein